MGPADFTHPGWFAELQDKLVEAEPGLYRLKSGAHPGMRYMCTTEIAQIYKRGGKTRRAHNILIAPSLESVAKINTWLDDAGYNRKSDGRPIFGLDSEEFYKRLRNIDERILMIPAHAWTPWFCFKKQKIPSGDQHLLQGYAYHARREIFETRRELS